MQSPVEAFSEEIIYVQKNCNKIALIKFTEELYYRLFLTDPSVAIAGISTFTPALVETEENQFMQKRF